MKGVFANELGLLAGFVVLAFWLLAMLSYSEHDSAWSTSGASALIHNRAGRLGAWLADGSYYTMGFSVWWCFAAGVRAWLTMLAQSMRSRELIPVSMQPSQHLHDDSGWLAGLHSGWD
jgi:DNA segregation ATPase FtsK/SpoIIIE, S-DNA-T family